MGIKKFEDSLKLEEKREEIMERHNPAEVEKFFAKVMAPLILAIKANKSDPNLDDINWMRVYTTQGFFNIGPGDKEKLDSLDIIIIKEIPETGNKGTQSQLSPGTPTSRKPELEDLQVMLQTSVLSAIPGK